MSRLKNNNFKQTSFDIMSFSVCLTLNFFEQDACSSKPNIACFLVYDISITSFEYCSLNSSFSLFNGSKMFTVGVDKQEGNIFDNVDVDDWESATRILYKVILINESVYKYINFSK